MEILVRYNRSQQLISWIQEVGGRIPVMHCRKADGGWLLEIELPADRQAELLAAGWKVHEEKPKKRKLPEVRPSLSQSRKSPVLAAPENPRL